MANPKEIFIAMVNNNITREGINDLLRWINDTDFYTAPSSTRFHGAYKEGLVRHSIDVYVQLKQLCKLYDCKASNESIAIVALFHDLCKIGCYKTDLRWRKDEHNKWEQYETYKFDEDFSFGGHGSKSMFLVSNFIQLTPEEAAAINCHMGAYDATSYSNPSMVYEKNLLAWLLHVADEAATYVTKN